MEGFLVFRFHILVHYVLEHLNNQPQVQVTSLHQIAVFVVFLAVADEHPESLHHFGLADDFSCVPVWLIPNELRNSFQQLQMWYIGVEASCGVLLLRLLGKLLDCALMVHYNQTQKGIH